MDALFDGPVVSQVADSGSVPETVFDPLEQVNLDPSASTLFDPVPDAAPGVSQLGGYAQTGGWAQPQQQAYAAERTQQIPTQYSQPTQQVQYGQPAQGFAQPQYAQQQYGQYQQQANFGQQAQYAQQPAFGQQQYAQRAQFNQQPGGYAGSGVSGGTSVMPRIAGGGNPSKYNPSEPRNFVMPTTGHSIGRIVMKIVKAAIGLFVALIVLSFIVTAIMPTFFSDVLPGINAIGDQADALKGIMTGLQSAAESVNLLFSEGGDLLKQFLGGQLSS